MRFREYIKEFLSQRKVLVLLLALFGVSATLNVYPYFEALKPSYKAVIGSWMGRSIQGGMGKIRVGTYITFNLTALLRPGIYFYTVAIEGA